MSKIKLRNGEWVLVCDGRKALLLRNHGDEMFPQLVTSEVFEQKADATHEYGSDAPGRVHQRNGSRRSAVEQTNWHDRVEQEFIKRLSEHLDRLVSSGKIPRIVLVAPARALGFFRASYSPILRSALKTEIEKDIVAWPIYKIEQALMA